MVLFADHWPHCNDLADTLTQTCSKERPHRCLPNAPPHDAWSAMWTTGGGRRDPGGRSSSGDPRRSARELRRCVLSAVRRGRRLLDADSRRRCGGMCSSRGVNDIASHTTPVWDAGITARGAGGRRERATDQAIAPGCLRPPPHTVAEQPLTKRAVPEAPPGRAVTLPADAIVLRHCDGDTPGRPPTCQIEGWPAACSCR